MKKEIKEKLDNFIKFQEQKVSHGISSRISFINRVYGVLKGLEFAGAITADEINDLYFEITNK